MDEYKEFLKKCYKKVKINLNYVDKLIESVYPWQGRNYLLSKIPNTNDYVPIDYNLYAIVKKLWKEGFVTLGWDEGSDMQMGFITVKKNNKTTISKLIKLFGNDNIILDNYIKNIKPNKIAKHETKLLNLKTYKIYIGEITDDAISISFDYNIIPKIHKVLGIKKTTRKPLPGDVSCSMILKIDYKKINKMILSSLDKEN